MGSMSLSAVKVSTAIIYVAVALSGCSTYAQHATPAKPLLKPKRPVPRTPIDKKAAELGDSTWNPQWNSIVKQALPAGLLSRRVPHDVRLFCPRFYEMSDTQKRDFWAYFFQALAGAEASLNPQATARHTEPKLAKVEDVPVTKVRTEGLLQLTYADSQRYGCPFDEAADRGLPIHDPRRTILQPKNNLICGVKILTNQLIDLHRPLVWGDSYWATLRPGTPGYRSFARQMTNPPAACRSLDAKRHDRPTSHHQNEIVSAR
jgi:hypothetical protein